MRRGARVLAALTCLALMCFGLWRLLGLVTERGAARESYKALDIYVEALPSADAPAEPSTQPAPTHEAAEPYQVDFEALARINPDVAAWLILEGTALSYPVVQGQDNEYYLDRLFDGSYNASGCLFLDSRCEARFTSPNSIVYGHHMKDGSMFAALDGYKEQEFYEAHPSLLLLTPGGDYEAQVFSAYVAPTDAAAWRLDFEGRELMPPGSRRSARPPVSRRALSPGRPSACCRFRPAVTNSRTRGSLSTVSCVSFK